MNQEEFGAYWGRAEQTLKERLGPYDLVCLRMPSALADEREGFGACLVGKHGGFAGSFVVYAGSTGADLKGRWISPSGVWYSFRGTLNQEHAIDELISFTRRVIKQEDAFDLLDFGAHRVP